jgi:chromosomal replication initiation ATPase DnaA
MKIDYYSDELQSLLLQVISFYENRGVKLKAVLSKSRTRPLPEVRAVYSVIAAEKYYKRYSLPQILGQINCDHSNYFHYNKLVSDLRRYDKNFRILFDEISIKILNDITKEKFLTMEDIHND